VLRDLNEGVGLSNTRARLAHLYPEAHAVRFDTAIGGGFTVTLSIPSPPDSTLEADVVQVPA
jgi:sensor histidine kinase YesM